MALAAEWCLPLVLNVLIHRRGEAPGSLAAPGSPAGSPGKPGKPREAREAREARELRELRKLRELREARELRELLTLTQPLRDRTIYYYTRRPQGVGQRGGSRTATLVTTTPTSSPTRAHSAGRPELETAGWGGVGSQHRVGEG